MRLCQFFKALRDTVQVGLGLRVFCFVVCPPLESLWCFLLLLPFDAMQPSQLISHSRHFRQFFALGHFLVCWRWLGGVGLFMVRRESKRREQEKQTPRRFVWSLVPSHTRAKYKKMRCICYDCNCCSIIVWVKGEFRREPTPKLHPPEQRKTEPQRKRCQSSQWIGRSWRS